MDNPLFHLNLTMRGCLAQVMLNGFPVISMDARRPVAFAPPINAFLVGTENTLIIEALLPPGGPANPLDADIRGSVSAFKKGDIVSPDGGGTLVQSVDLRRFFVGKKLEFPLRAVYRFDNEGPRFPTLFLESEVIDDPESLLDYAVFLKGLAQAFDAASLAVELGPKIRDYAAAYDSDAESMRAQLIDFFQTTVFPGPMELDFGRADIVPVPWCAGRVWELRRAPDEPLFATKPDAEGGRCVIPVYVARMGGALKVVR